MTKSDEISSAHREEFGTDRFSFEISTHRGIIQTNDWRMLEKHLADPRMLPYQQITVVDNYTEEVYRPTINNWPGFLPEIRRLDRLKIRKEITIVVGLITLGLVFMIGLIGVLRT